MMDVPTIIDYAAQEHAVYQADKAKGFEEYFGVHP
jgi:hypothetical protein